MSRDALDAGDLARQAGPFEIGQHQPPGVRVGSPFRFQLVVSILEVLRDLVDDLRAADWAARRGPPPAVDVVAPVRRGDVARLVRHVRGS